MHQRVMVVVDDRDELGPVEDIIVVHARAGAAIHVVSTDDVPEGISEEMSPRRLRLMLLLARLADRGVVATGEVAQLRDPAALPGIVGRAAPDVVRVADSSHALDVVTDGSLAALGVPVVVVTTGVGEVSRGGVAVGA